eukprot:TRINITY_DN2315_c0_g1_i10.p1 TRINITY_DN2315_c0_g1~~TRINITY_DN2315_c0_g1_i10.p1  ORF type:complete len:150 (-),score=40.77 TRINITY_DN2315_c0_g1_i10:96-545(-)
MGSLMPGWDQNIAVSEQAREDDCPWWLNRKEVVNFKDSEARRQSVDSLRRTSLDVPDKRRLSYERRASVELSENSVTSKIEDSEVDDEGNVRMLWWKRLMSNHLNEKPDSKPDDYRSGSYQPQFDIAGQLQYSTPSKELISFPLDEINV